jgi:hypothetical protein
MGNGVPIRREEREKDIALLNHLVGPESTILRECIPLSLFLSLALCSHSIQVAKSCKSTHKVLL